MSSFPSRTDRSTMAATTTKTTTAAPPSPATAPKWIQLFISLLGTKTLTLHFPQSQPPTPQTLTHRLQTLTLIAPQFQTLTLNGHILSNSSLPIPNSSTITLTIRCLGGKGGFGSLLRGAVTKAGQKKTNNFDACRDMSGRRLRHVNAEKRLEEWREEEKERELERKAEEFLKQKAKKARGEKGGGSGVEGYVEKYREESERCVREVERSVREAVKEGLVAKKKRKVLERLRGKGKGDDGVEEKKSKIWMGKRKLADNESDDSDDADDDVGEDDALSSEKSVVIDTGNQSDSSKGDSQSSGSVPVEKLDTECYTGGSSDNGSEQEKEADGKSADSDGSQYVRGESSAVDPSGEREELIKNQESGFPEKGCPADTVIITPPSTVVGIWTGLEVKQVVAEDNGVADPENIPQDRKIMGLLNFDDYSSAAALEVLGMEKLKSELQARGLKCGGTLQERAARLYLLKTTPIDKLPKKLLAKK